MSKKIILLFLVISNISFSQITFQKTYGGELEEECDAVVQTEDGGFILAGSTRSYGNGNYDLYIIRTDPYGDTLWTRTFGGTGHDTANDIVKIDAENYLIAGSLDGKVYLIKIKDDGNVVWTRTIGNEEDFAVTSAKKTGGGGFIFCGITHITNYFVLFTHSNGDSISTKIYKNGSARSIEPTTDGGYVIMIRPGNFLHPQNDFVIIKRDIRGDSLWTSVFSGPNAEVGWEVEQTTDGGFMLAGHQDGSVVGKSDFYLVKADSTGLFLWDKTYGGDEMDKAYSAMQTSDGGFVLGGFTASFNVGYFDFYIVRTNSVGDTLWTRTYGGEWQEEIADIVETSDGGFAAVGYTYSFDESNFPNIYFVKTDANGLITDVKDHNHLNEIRFSLNQNYPNPFNPRTSIEYKVGSLGAVTLKVYDILGNEVATLVKEEKPAGTYKVTWSAANLPSGVYFYQLKAGSFTATKKLLLLK